MSISYLANYLLSDDYDSNTIFYIYSNNVPLSIGNIYDEANGSATDLLSIKHQKDVKVFSDENCDKIKLEFVDGPDDVNN